MKKFSLMFLIGLFIVPFVYAQNCTDTDNGLNYYVKGVVSGKWAHNDTYSYKEEDYCSWDEKINKVESCEGNRCSLIEFYCTSDTNFGNTPYTCPNGCKDGACIKKCAKEGEYTTGAVSPEYYYGCCEGLKGYNTQSNIVGAGLLCYNPNKGTPVCKFTGTKSEGWYYSETGELLRYETCETTKCTDSDGGIDYYKYGEAKKGHYIGTDCCATNAIGGPNPACYVPETGATIDLPLWEYTCENNEITVYRKECPSGCQNGACIKETECPVIEIICEEGSVIETYIGDDGCPKKRCTFIEEKCPSNQKLDIIDVKNNDGKLAVNYYSGPQTNPVEIYFGKASDGDLEQCEIVQGCSTNAIATSRSYTYCTAYTNCNYPKDNQAYVVTIHDKKCALSDKYNFVPYIGPQGIYVKLGEKFSLRQGDEAKVVDYSYMKIRLNTIATLCGEPFGCKDEAHLTVEIPPTETTTASTATGKEFTLRVGDSEEVFGAKITFLGVLPISEESNTRSAMFIVEKSSVSDLVDIEIYPKEQTIKYGDKAVYKVKVIDKHPPVRCASNTRCIMEPLTYQIHIRNLPFYKEYPNKIEVPYGGTEEFELIVSPYQKVPVEMEAVEILEESKEEVPVTGQVVAKAVKEQEKLITKSAQAAVEATAVQEKVAIATTQQMIARNIRQYKFSITAKQQNDPKVQDTTSAVLIIEPEIPQPPTPIPPEFQGEKIRINLEKGWNLISLPGKLLKFDKESIGNQKLIGYVYIKEKQKYYSLKEAEEILGDKLREYLAKNSFWIYSKKPFTLVVYIDKALSLEDIDLVEGWNLVPVTEDMVGGYLTDITGDCDIEKIYLWEAINQEWKEIDLSYSFGTSQLSYGFLIKSKNYCMLSGPTILPPSMPE